MLTHLDASNQVTTYSYNANLQPLSIVYPSGLYSGNVYESDGWLVTNILSTQVGLTLIPIATNTYTYTNDLVLTHTDPRGLTTSSTWDNLQRLTSMEYPDGTFVTNIYRNLDLVQTVDRMGFTNSFGYDSMRRKIFETNANGVVTAYGYCTCGALTSVTNALGTSVQAVTTFDYDNQDNLTETVYPDGYTVNNYYDLLRQLTNSVDSGGVSVTNWFNNQGLKYAASNYFGQVFSLTFDLLDRTATNVDANGVSTVITYDNLNLYPHTHPSRRRGGVLRVHV